MRRLTSLGLPLTCSVIVASAICSSAMAEESTWGVIRDHIFGGNCASCHQEGTGFARQSDLLLTPDVAYDQLIDTAPKNLAAQEDGLLRVSTAGGFQGLGESYLWEKINVTEQDHFYADHPGYGALMPMGQQSLTNGELNFIGRWIFEGAPETGIVADMSLLDDTSRYEPPEFIPLEAPEQGIQLHLGPFPVWPAEEHDREFFYYQPYETTEDQFVSRYEISYREGSHHFILYNYADGEPTPRAEEYRDVRDANGRDLPDSESLGLFPFQVFLLSQAPYTTYSLPKGVALRLPEGQGFDLNVHSVNRGSEETQGEVYVNMHTVDADELDHVAEYKSFGNFDITLPPNRETTISKTFRFSETENILQMWTHAHEKMTEFRIEYAGGERDGEVIYWTNDWEHPPILEFDDPLTFHAGDRIRMITTWLNETDQTVSFGPLSSDEMQFLFYIQYPGSTVAGDVDEDGQLTLDDLHALSRQIRNHRFSDAFDLNFDGVLDQDDRIKWVERLANTFFGDSDFDGEFTTADLVMVFTAGEYEDGIARNSTWDEGDWDGDGDFGSGDLVMAFSRGGYEVGPRDTLIPVPEPSAMLLTFLGLSIALAARRHRRRHNIRG